MTKKALENELRLKWTKMVFEYLESLGEDVGFIKDNVFNFPVLDSDGNEREIEITVKVPKGSIKDNEPYDLYGLRQEYKINQELKAQKELEKIRKKEADLKRKAELRRKKEELKKEKDGR